MTAFFGLVVKVGKGVPGGGGGGIFSRSDTKFAFISRCLSSKICDHNLCLFFFLQGTVDQSLIYYKKNPLKSGF